MERRSGRGGGGIFFTEFRVGLCRQKPSTLILSKTKFFHFVILSNLGIN